MLFNRANEPIPVSGKRIIMKQTGRLILIPSDLGSETIDHVWPATNLTAISHIRHFVVENERTARRFLRKAGYDAGFGDVTFYVLNKHTTDSESSTFLDVADSGHDIGLLSEAGVPCIADPGQRMVALAHQKHIRVLPLVGPSSILLALMSSGFNGQQFEFHGYLPIDKKERDRKVKSMEQHAYRQHQTQIFMEAPYRNNQLMDDLLRVCANDTLLCVACDLTLPSAFIHTHPIHVWKKNMPDLHKRPGIFLIYHP